MLFLTFSSSPGHLQDFVARYALQKIRERSPRQEIKKLYRQFPLSVWAREFELKPIGFGEGGEMPKIIIQDMFGDPYDPDCEKDMAFPRQKSIISQIKEFNISPPTEESISFIHSSEDDRFNIEDNVFAYITKALIRVFL